MCEGKLSQLCAEQEAPSEGLASAPVLVHGCDDIYWVNHMHGALSSKGYFPGDEEMESWFFGDQTQSALLTFQVPTKHQTLLLSCKYPPPLVCGLSTCI